MNETQDFQARIVEALDLFNQPAGMVLVVVLCLCGIWFTIRTRGVQFRMIGEAFRLLFAPAANDAMTKGKRISSFEAFNVSLASRIGTGNLAGVATAIALGGPGAIFWMWVMALIGGANSFVECTLAQLFKSKGKDSFVGGPAYYIRKGLKSKWFGYVFAVTIILAFGVTNTMVQSNTINLAFSSAFSIDTFWMSIALTVFTLVVIFGGVHRIARFSSIVVPVMALLYFVVTIVVFWLRYDRIPEVFMLIVSNAFGVGPALGGGVGMAIILGFKRGLFSNEAGEGSAPNVAATADVSHPVKQGLIQALGVFTDTLLVCSCTAFIILCSGLYNNGANGVELTQLALTDAIGESGKIIIAILIFFFAYSSVIGNYYYGETNLYFMTKNKTAMFTYRVIVGGVVFIGGIMTLEVAWGLVDVFMFIMTACNIVAILMLGKYAIRCLEDYRRQRKEGKNPVYHRSVNPEIASETPCWPE